METDGGCIGKSKGPGKETRSSLEGQLNPEMSNTNNNEEITAVAPITADADYYNMDHKYRGLLIIFNHEVFNPDTKQPRRSGTDEDVVKIKETFESLGFEVHPHKDCTLAQIQDHIKNYVKCDHYHKQRDCLAIFVLTHGDKDTLWAKDHWYNPAEELWGRFTSDKCPSLAGKPKLVFLQACQGRDFDKGIKMLLPQKRKHPNTEFDGHFFYEFPVNADFLVFYATYEGYYAFRNDVNGSYWVTLLCQALREHYKNRDLLTILTVVNRKLGLEFSSSNSKDPSKHGMKQISYFKSSLTRLLVFGEK